ncbi:MAG: PilN domain-containing protein [Proteobacteria bacterium]|nr:PilN domain-containing protein [Pseudomonadota bacterium]
MIKINLLPVRAAAKMESVRKNVTIAALIMVLLAIIVAYFDMGIKGRIEGLNSSISKTQQQIEDLKKIIAKVNKFKKDKKVLSKKLSAIKKLNARRIAPIRFMDELSTVMPEKLWLDKLVEDKWKLKMSGLGVNHDVIADFMSNMEKSPMFTKVKLKSTAKKAKKGALTLMKFSIEAKFVPPKKKEG